MKLAKAGHKLAILLPRPGILGMCHQTQFSLYGSFPQDSVPSRVLRPLWNKATPDPELKIQGPILVLKYPRRHYFCPRNSTLSYEHPISTVIQLNCPPPPP